MNERTTASVEWAAIRISILLQVISCANSRARVMRRSFVDSRESLAARASRKAKEEVLNEVPTRTTEDPLGEAEALELEVFLRSLVSEPLVSRLLFSEGVIVAGCATRVDFKNR